MTYRLLMFVGALAAGYLFWLADMPIPWLLGGIFSALLLKTYRPLLASWPRIFRSAGLVVVGYGIGRNFTPNTWDAMLVQAGGMIGATVIAVIVALGIAIWTAKWEKVDLQSCIMGIMPGGFTQMAVMADEDERADKNIVIVMQSLRLISIIVAVPFLVVHGLGAEMLDNQASLNVTDAYSFWPILPFAALFGYFCDRMNFSTPYLIGPIIIAAACNFHFGLLNSVPMWLMVIAQICIGINMGVGLEPEKLKQMKRLMPYIFAGIVAMLIVSIGVAYVLADYYEFSLITAFLAMAPGGLGEMCLVGMSLGENVAIILTYQMFRFLFLNIAVPVGINGYFGKPHRAEN